MAVTYVLTDASHLIIDLIMNVHNNNNSYY